MSRPRVWEEDGGEDSELVYNTPGGEEVSSASGPGRVEWEVFSHVGSELKLGHTQVIFPTVQDDAGL